MLLKYQIINTPHPFVQHTPTRHLSFLAILDMQTILIKLRSPFSRLFPRHPILGKLLHRRSQRCLHQREIVHTAQTQDAHAWERSANTIHERAARVTEVIRHGVVFASFFVEHGLRLAEFL